MAATNKSIEVSIKKSELINKIAEINIDIHRSCACIPKNIIDSPREVTVIWRSLAEKYYHKTFGDSGSLSLKQLIKRENERMELLSGIRGDEEILKKISYSEGIA